MAINMQDKRGLMDQILPAVQLNLTSAGITVISDRLEHSVTIPFDHSGKCTECKATETEADYAVTKEGVWIWCTRLKKQPRFVGFDYVYDLPGHTFIKIRNKARVFNVPHGIAEPVCIAKQITLPAPQLPPIPEEKPELFNFPLPPPPPPKLAKQVMDLITEAQIPSAPPQPELAQEFMENISAATTGMDMATQTNFPKETATLAPGDYSGISVDIMPQEMEQEQTEEEKKEWEGVQDFMNSIAAATTGLNFASAGVQQMQTAEEMEEEKNAIEAIKSNLHSTF